MLTTFFLLTFVFLLSTCSTTTTAMSSSSPAAALLSKRILVTGANKGIGRAIVERLLTEWSDTHVILAARDASRGKQAVQDILQSTQCAADRLEFLQLDVSSDESVQAAAQKFAPNPPLHAIINNAGVGWGYSTADTINTNYFGARRVNDAFGKFLKRPGGRVVNVASASGPNFVSKSSGPLEQFLGQPWTITGGISQLDELARSMPATEEGYGSSKALLNAYTHLHARSEPDLLINSCTPGYIDTDLTANMGATNPPSKGAVPPCWLAMDETSVPKEPTGRYYGSDCVRSPLHVYRGPGDAPYVSNEDL